MGEILFFRFRCQIAWRPSLFLIGTLEEHLIPIGPFFHLQYNLLTFKKNLCATLVYALPFHRNLLENSEVIYKQNWRMVYYDFEEVSNKYYLYHMFSP